MNFLEIINNCLLELNYRQVSAFSELVKNDHKRIISIVNVINKEICNSEKWNFLLRNGTIHQPKNTTEIINPIEGRIVRLSEEDKPLIFTDNINVALQKSNTKYYSCMNNKLILPNTESDKDYKVIYYTNNCVIDDNGREKTDLETATDTTLIPMPFAEQILVYGTCLRMKANPQHFKFSYWISMYKQALLNLKSSEYSSITAPIIRISRH